MIPLVGNPVVLSRVETAKLRHNSHNNIAFTIVQPQSQLNSISNISNAPAFRILQSRAQRRSSSVSSLSSVIKVEDDGLRKLNSRGSVGTIPDDQLRLCFRTRPLTQQHGETENNVSLDGSSCSSYDVKENDKIDLDNCSDSRMPDVAIDNQSPDNYVKSKKSKCKSRSAKSNSNGKSKKHSKSKKSPKRKMKSSHKIPDVFERLASITKNNGNNQEKMSTSPNNKKSNQTIFYSKPCGSLLEIKRLQATYIPVNKPNKPRTLLYLPEVALCKTTSNRNVLQSTRQLKSTKSNSQIENSLRKSLEIDNNNYSPRKSLNVIIQKNSSNSFNGSKKVYLSEMQSKLIGGIPAAPPVTPFPDELARIEYIPCLMDIKSQRAVKTKLEKIVHKSKLEEQQRKENTIKQNEKKLKESVLQLKQKQRAEIYALNKVMTDLENDNFHRFMTKKEAVSLGV